MTGNRTKIVVAEDNSVQRMLICQLIEKLGYEAIQTVDGMEALDKVQNTGSQIVISDFRMPKLNGIELTQKIRELDLDRYVHIIMITGSEEDDVRSEAMRAGVDDFITKGKITLMLKARISAATRLIQHEQELAERTRILKESNDRIQADLRAAAAAQRRLLPDMHGDLLGFRIASAFVPSSFVSGDMFGCFPISEENLAFYAVDVSGHGVHASLLSVAIGHLITPEFFQTKALDVQGKPDPAALVADLNVRFGASGTDEYFTMFCGVLNSARGRIDYCQAGYPSPYYVTSDGQTELVGDGGLPVGLIDNAEYENNNLAFELGASLVVCSDGATEAENTVRQPFGTDQLKEIVSSIPHVGAENIPDRIVQVLTDWRSGQPLEDDLTIVALERTK